MQISRERPARPIERASFVIREPIPFSHFFPPGTEPPPYVLPARPVEETTAEEPARPSKEDRRAGRKPNRSADTGEEIPATHPSAVQAGSEPAVALQSEDRPAKAAFEKQVLATKATAAPETGLTTDKPVSRETSDVVDDSFGEGL